MNSTENLLLTIILIFGLTLNLEAQGPQEVTPFKLSFVYPVSTSGTQSPESTNKVSINILGGYSKGTTAFEMGGFINANKEFTKGFQVSGLANVSGKGQRSVQLAGLTNLNTNQTSGVQFAGITNIIAEGNIDLQLAGISNVADTATVQVGLFNVARKVNNAQVGLVNITEETDGVPIGLVNVVKDDGLKDFEASFSEALNTSLSFKLGTDELYSIFSGGVNYLQDPMKYAIGLGFGSSLKLGENYRANFEALSYSVSQNKKFKTDINLLTQVKTTVAKEFSSDASLFAGPVLNLTVSELNSTGATELAPYTVWQNDASTKLKGWVGFTGGLRF